MVSTFQAADCGDGGVVMIAMVMACVMLMFMKLVMVQARMVGMVTDWLNSAFLLTTVWNGFFLVESGVFATDCD